MRFTVFNRSFTGLSLLTALTLLIPMALTTSAAEPPSDANIISTQGHAEIEVKPDSLALTVAVNTKNPQMTFARDENNRKMAAIVKALESLKIKGLELETKGINVHPVFEDYRKDHLRKVIGYEVNNTLEVSVKRAQTLNLETIGSQLIDTALNTGASNVSHLSFFLDDIASAQSKSLALAVQNARLNADVMARTAGVEIVGVYAISGSPQQHSRNSGHFFPMAAKMMMSDASEEQATPVKSGTTSIQSTVHVRFKF